MKKIIVSLAVIVLSLWSCEEQNIKSKKTALHQINILLDSANLETLDKFSRSKIADRVLLKISEWPNDSLKTALLFKIANRYYNIKEFKNYYSVSKSILRNSIKIKDSSSICKASYYLADYHTEINNADSAFYYTNYGTKVASKANLKDYLSQGQINKALIFISQNDYTSGERELYKVLQFFKKNPNENMLVQTYELLGLTSINLQQYELAEEYYQKLMAIGKNYSDPSLEFLSASASNNIGLIKLKEKEYENAVDVFKMAIKSDSLKNKRFDIYITIFDNLEYTRFKLNKKHNYDKTARYLIRAKDSIKDSEGAITTLLRLSEYQQQLNDSLSAKGSAKLAYNKSREIASKKDQTLALKQLIKVDRANASKYAEEYIRISDSLQVAERRIRNKLARIEYETDELIVEKNSLIEQRKSIIYITLALLTIGAFVFIIRIQMAKNRELILIQQQQKANEEIYELMLSQQSKMEAVRQTEKRNIARELHDGVLGKLFGTRLNLGLLNEKNTEKAAEERVQFIEELKKIEQEIREISHDLSQEKAAVVNNFVLVLNDYFEKQKHIASASITLDISDNIKWQEIDNLTKINLYRIVQECLQNINKHAQATEAHFNITQIENQLHLQVIDNGIGFNANKEKKGIGLKNIDLRVKQSKASMEIYSEKNKGTTFLFKFPLTSYA
ncbi:tetratricopeptide repeat-containing sensor histidine kinase [Flavobacterium sp.]|uniref:ATP-binding protein n=1 Tax=Flavobacterium sp. TaxID=239 RepID=UPI0026367498|nr:tetratricopeptide repeat-containing sensor histidine kinase [Flavobacterium sp.]